MEYLRTPDDRFEELKDYPFAANYTEIEADDGTRLRMHYIDEGEGELILCLHGQPSWSYLYRKMIPVFVEHGYRVIAPDLIGFGKSDKPINRSDYTFAAHVAWVKQFLAALSLSNITLVCQDWGSLIGLRVLAEETPRFARVVLSNGGLPDGAGMTEDMAPMLHNLLASTPVLDGPEMRDKLFGPMEDRPPFMYWIRHCDGHPAFHPAEVMKMFLNHCDDDEYRAWAAPFPSTDYMAGARQFPSLVPLMPDDPAMAANRAAWGVLQQFQRPFLTLFGDSDPVTKGGERRFIEEVPGAMEQNHVILENAGHFSQDDSGDLFAQHVINFISADSAGI